MKKLMILTALLLMKLTVVAQEKGIQFNQNGKWADILAQAKAENKLIFMDAYAVWCGPCKMMDKNVFSQSEIGHFFNQNFINVKMDMEKGEGISLSQSYSVLAYPTFLFIDSNGKVMHRVVGYFEPDAFLEVGQTAINPETRLAALEARYDAGERSAEFVTLLMQAFENAMHPRAAEVVDAYLDSQSDWSTPENMQLIVSNLKSTDSRFFNYVVKNYAAFEQSFGQYEMLGTLQSAILNEAFASATTMPSLDDIHTAYKAKTPADLAEKLFAVTKMNYYRAQQDMEKFAAATIDYYQKYPSTDFQELNEQAWSFYLSVDNKEHLKEALKWAQKSVEISSQYFNNDTLAALYFKLGDKKNAKKAAEKAIEIAKTNGEDYTETEKLLEEIKKM